MKAAAIRLSAALLLAAMPVAAQFSGGSGTAADPYRIATAAELDAIRGAYLGAPGAPVHFRQTADIDLAAYGNWQPIGSLTTPARVVYDGNNRRVSNLSINRPTESMIGLFGMLAGTVRNLKLESGSVVGNGYVGAFAGRLESGGLIEDCASRIDVSGAGGIAGGLVGYSFGTIRRAYVRAATVSGDNSIGGLVGINAGAIQTCYAAAAVSGSRNTGGLAGGAGSGHSVSASYWDTAASGQPGTYGDGTGLGTTAMQQRASFADWDFNTVWRLYEGHSYPYLRALAPTAPMPDANPDGGSFPGTQISVVVTTQGDDGMIHYTVNGASPDDESPSVASGGSVDVPLPGQLGLIGWAPYYNPSPLVTFVYEAAPRVENPEVSPPLGAYPGEALDVIVRIATPDSTVHYTLDGSDPTADTPHTVADGGLVSMPLPGTLKLRAFHPSLNPSDVVTANYVAADRVTAPVLSPSQGAFPGDSVAVQLSVVPTNATLRYTLDGSDPTESEGIPATHGQIVDVPLTDTHRMLRVRGFHAEYNPSLVTTGIYERAAAALPPVLDPPGGAFTQTHVSVKLTSASTGASIHYTLDGTEPTAQSSSVVSNSGTVTVPITIDGITLKARAFREDLNPGSVVSAVYKAADPVATPVFSPEGGSQPPGTVSVAVTSATPGATIRYSLDGFRPGIDSPVVASGAAVTVPVPGVLKARAWRDGMFTSEIRSAYYGDFAGGSGTAADPYLIATPDHLNNVRYDLTAHYRLIADIDLNVSPWNSGHGWEPIGSWANRFVGVLDGAGHVVWNLLINRPDVEDVGLLGAVGVGGRVLNLGVGSGSVTGRDYVGGIVGSNQGTLAGCFSNCAVVSMVSSASGGAGGLVGWGDESGSIVNSSATGSVTGPGSVGGLAGNTLNALTNVYAAGEVFAGAARPGGLIGFVRTAPVSSAYWDVEASGMATSAGPEIGLSTAQMRQKTAFSGWDFDTVWAIDEGQDYPRLRVFDRQPEEIPHEWLIYYFGAEDMAPARSVTGQPLLWAYIAGLDPTDAASVFAISRSDVSGATLELRVPSVTGRVYRVQTRASLTAGQWQAVTGVASQTGTGAVLTFDIPTPPSAAFYCIMVSLDAP